MLLKTSRLFKGYFFSPLISHSSLLIANKVAVNTITSSVDFFSQLNSKRPDLNSVKLSNQNQVKQTDQNFLFNVLAGHISKRNHLQAIETLDLMLIQQQPDIDVASITYLMANCLKTYKRRCPIRKETYFKIEGLELMERIVGQLQSAHLDLDVELLNMLLYSYAMLRKPNLEKIQELLYKYETTPNTSTYNNVILGYTRDRNMYMARKMYREMVYTKKIPPSAHTFSIMIFGYIKQKKLSNAIRCYYEMLERKITPNSFIFTHLIYGSLRLGDVKEALFLYESMLEETIFPTVFTVETLIKGLCRQAHVDEAVNIFKSLKQFNYQATLSMYSEIVEGYFRLNRIKEAKFYWALQLSSSSYISFKSIDRVILQLLKNDLIQDVESALKTLNTQFKYQPSQDLTEALLQKGILSSEAC